MLLASFVNTNQDVKLLTRKSSGIRTWADLAGKRIGTLKGTSAHYYLDVSLLFEGTPTKGIEIVSLPPEQLGQALISGKVDAVAIWEPFAYEIKQSLGSDALQLPGNRIYTTSFNLSGLKPTVTNRQSDVLRVLKALDKAERFIAEHPAEAQGILRTALRMDQAFIDAVWKNYNYRLQLNQSLLSTMEGQARWAQRSGYVPQGIPGINMLDIIDTELLQQVSPAAVTLPK